VTSGPLPEDLPVAEEPPPTQVWPSLAELGGLPREASPEEPPPTQVWPSLAELGGLPRETSPDEPPPTQVWPPSRSSRDSGSGVPGGVRSDAATGPRRHRRLEILEVHDGLAYRTHFEVLGVPRDATEAQVREAYFRLAKRFHPDVHHDAALSDLRDKLEEVFTRLGEAYEVLCSPRMRASYERSWPRERGLKHAPAPQATRSARPSWPPRRSAKGARAWLRRGTGKPSGSSSPPFRGGRGRQAAGARPARRAYAKNPGWVKQGEELLLAVLREEPDHLDALLQLGRIYKGQGLRSRALSTLRRVLDLDPAREEARGLIAELGP